MFLNESYEDIKKLNNLWEMNEFFGTRTILQIQRLICTIVRVEELFSDIKG